MEFSDKWGRQYPAITRLWENAWSEFVPFLDYDVEIRRVICSTNAIESVNAHYRRAVRARGHFPTEQAALKCLYLAIRALDPTGKGRARWATRWKPALNAFAISFDGSINKMPTVDPPKTGQSPGDMERECVVLPEAPAEVPGSAGVRTASPQPRG